MLYPYWECYVECKGNREYTEVLPYHGESESMMEAYILAKHENESPMFYRATLIEKEPEKPKAHDGFWHLANQRYDDMAWL